MVIAQFQYSSKNRRRTTAINHVSFDHHLVPKRLILWLQAEPKRACKQTDQGDLSLADATHNNRHLAVDLALSLDNDCTNTSNTLYNMCITCRIQIRVTRSMLSWLLEKVWSLGSTNKMIRLTDFLLIFIQPDNFKHCLKIDFSYNWHLIVYDYKSRSKLN